MAWQQRPLEGDCFRWSADSVDTRRLWTLFARVECTARMGSVPERPVDHQRELLTPERTTVPTGSLLHHDGASNAHGAQRIDPPGRVVQEELLLRPGDEIDARRRCRHDRGRPEPGARRCAEDGAVDVRVSQAQGRLRAERTTDARAAS